MMKLKTAAAFAVAVLALAACPKKHDTKVVDPGDETGTSDRDTGKDRDRSDGGETTTVTGDDGDSTPSFAAVYFEYDSSELSADSRKALDELASWLEAHPKATITIEGNTDERGTDEYNIALGEKRAHIIQTYLERLGIDADRLATVSWGEEHPADSGSDEDAWARNRRGELVPKPSRGSLSWWGSSAEPKVLCSPARSEISAHPSEHRRRDRAFCEAGLPCRHITIEEPVKINALLVTCLFAAACGGGKKPTRPYAPPEVPDERAGEDVEPAPDEEEEAPEPPPPPPQVWHARADLAPVKGAKAKPATVSFSQTEGEAVQVTSDALAGLKAGAYHLVIHEAAACGKNATKAGPPWMSAAAAPLDVAVAKGATASLDTSVDLMLDGDESIIGHTLVLHADKKGKAGKAMACGAIVAVEPDDDAASDSDDADE
jgi:peptidoglycan-associated lipoprotein